MDKRLRYFPAKLTEKYLFHKEVENSPAVHQMKITVRDPEGWQK